MRSDKRQYACERERERDRERVCVYVGVCHARTVFCVCLPVYLYVLCLSVCLQACVSDCVSGMGETRRGTR